MSVFIIGLLMAVAMSVGFTLAFDLDTTEAAVVGLACGLFVPAAIGIGGRV